MRKSSDERALETEEIEKGTRQQNSDEEKKSEQTIFINNQQTNRLIHSEIPDSDQDEKKDTYSSLETLFNEHFQMKQKIAELNHSLEEALAHVKGILIAKRIREQKVKLPRNKDNEIKTAQKRADVLKYELTLLTEKIKQNASFEKITNLENQLHERQRILEELQQNYEGLIRIQATQNKAIKDIEWRNQALPEKTAEICREVRRLKQENALLRTKQQKTESEINKIHESCSEIEKIIHRNLSLLNDHEKGALKEDQLLTNEQKKEINELRMEVERQQKGIELLSHAKESDERKYHYELKQLDMETKVLQSQLNESEIALKSAEEQHLLYLYYLKDFQNILPMKYLPSEIEKDYLEVMETHVMSQQEIN